MDHDPVCMKLPEQANPWRKPTGAFQALGEGDGERLLTGSGVFFQDDGNVLELDTGGSSWLCERTKCH